jgi:hypothetical protein
MAYLISGQSATGTGYVKGSAVAAYWSDKGYVMLECSGNSASASLWTTPDPANVPSDWMQVTAWAAGPNTTATAQLSAFYPYLLGQVDWVSGGTNTATVNLQVVTRKQWPA